MKLRILATAGVLSLTIGAALADAAVAANADAATAATYARAAATATTIEDVHRNMRMALNCLVGRADQDFVEGLETRCATPEGAIRQSDGMANVAYRLAAQIAKTALALDSLGGAQFAARTAERMIASTDPTRPMPGDPLENAQYLTGTVRMVDVAARTMMMGADTYYARETGPNLISEVKPGEQVQVTYILQEGRRIALHIRKAE